MNLRVIFENGLSSIFIYIYLNIYIYTDRLVEEQTLIRKLKTDTHGLNQDLDFLTPYMYFHK